MIDYLFLLFVGHGVGLNVSFGNVYIWKVIQEETGKFYSEGKKVNFSLCLTN
jgi:hypothetical protein